MRLFSNSIRRFFAANDFRMTTRPVSIENLEGRQFLSVSTSPIGVTPQPVVPPVTVIQAITPLGVLIHSEAGEPFTGIVGRVRGVNSTALGARLLANPTDYQALINWGDGSAISTGTIYVDKNNAIAVGGTHTYAAKGDYKITVTIENILPVIDPPTAAIAQLIVVQIQSTAAVSANVEGGVHLVETANQPFTADVGNFYFGNGDLAFSATITWGDGTTSSGVVEHRPNGNVDDWSVVGTHTYSKIGTYDVRIGVTGRPISIPGQPTPEFILELPPINSVIDVVAKA